MKLSLQVLFTLTLLTSVVLSPSLTNAADDQDPLTDLTGDEIVTVLGFGDSITFGFGDGTTPNQVDVPIPPGTGQGGYLKRVREQLGLSTINSGNSGEHLFTDGIFRIPDVARNQLADLVAFMEGSNDANKRVDVGDYSRTVQKAINVLRASGKRTLILTLPPPCCNHGAQAPITRSYSAELRKLAFVNELSLVDIEKAWDSSCTNPSECEFYNRPEGLHPNLLGYDVIGQMVMATLLDIDIFAEGGAADLEDALELPEGTVVIKPVVLP